MEYNHGAYAVPSPAALPHQSSDEKIIAEVFVSCHPTTSFTKLLSEVF
jgi:hypothetical protein